LNDIAGTSHARYQHFLALVDRFHAAWQQYFNPRILQQRKLSASEFDTVPKFAFTEEPFGAVARRAGYGLLGLLLPVALIGWFGVQRLRRFPLA
jgi:ABC-2 type transport system permease protein